jgi:hypothetical protein
LLISSQAIPARNPLNYLKMGRLGYLIIQLFFRTASDSYQSGYETLKERRLNN